MRGRKKAKLTRRQRERRRRAELRHDNEVRARIHRQEREEAVLSAHPGAHAPRHRTPELRLSDAELRDGELLSTCLSFAVPIAIMELQRKPWAEVERIARECGEVIASHGDVIQYRVAKSKPSRPRYLEGEPETPENIIDRHASMGTAEAFAFLARGVACLAFTPGGITYMGAHYEAVHPSRATSPPATPATP